MGGRRGWSMLNTEGNRGETNLGGTVPKRAASGMGAAKKRLTVTCKEKNR